MTVTYEAIVGYGFFSNIAKTDWTDPSTHERRDRLWDLMPKSTRKYFGSKEYYFEEDFDQDSFREMISKRFPDLRTQWYGNPYSNNRDQDSLFIAVKTTFVSSDVGEKPVDLREHAFVSADARAQLAQVADLFGQREVEPGWFSWLQVG